jgi:hypothetical protein
MSGAMQHFCDHVHRCVGVILALLRQFPAFWTSQQQGEWNPATREQINTGMPSVGPLDDLEVHRPPCPLAFLLLHLKKEATAPARCR